jgi:hypothetical protein
MISPLPSPEAIHPSLWRASQLARGRGRVVETGYPALSAELPGGGWPVGALIDLMVQQAGVGELRLLRPALSGSGNRPVAFVQPPHTPDGLGLSYIGLPIDQVLRVKAQKTADALWSAEQILRAGSCGALIFWAQYAQASSLRRLHLAAQSSENSLRDGPAARSGTGRVTGTIAAGAQTVCRRSERRHCEAARTLMRRAPGDCPSTYSRAAVTPCASLPRVTCRSCDWWSAEGSARLNSLR